MASDGERDLSLPGKATSFAAYAAYRALEFLMRSLPLRWCFALGSILGRLAGRLFFGYRRLALRNLRIAFGREKSERELSRMASQHFARLGANLLCSLKIPYLSQEEVASCTATENMEPAEAAIQQGRGLVYALLHMGNWEVLSQLEIFAAGGRPATMFQRLANPYLNAHVRKLRAKIGCQLFDRKDGFFGPIRWLRDNGAIGILVDQHAGDAGVWTPFFGRLASTTNLVALLAQRTGAPIVPVSMTTTGPAQWRFSAGQPVDLSGSADDVAARLNLAVEHIIRQSPADWFWVHNRWKTPKPEFLLRNYKRGIRLPEGFSMDQLQPFEILVRSPNWLGDTCMASPAVRAIKRGRPDARVSVLTPAKLADLWRQVPEVDAVIEIPHGGGLFAARRAVKATGVRYEAAVLLPNSLRCALEVWRLAPRLVGYKGHWRRKLLDQIVPPNKQSGPPKHHSEHYLRIALRLGADVKDPQLYSQFLAPATQHEGHAPIRFGVCPGAEYGPAKRWPVDSFAEAIRLVAEKEEGEWTIFGAKGDAEIGQALEKQLGGNCRNLTGQTTLLQLCEELRKCRLILTNDTGTMHLAALLGVPTVSIFGSTEPDWTGPLGEDHIVLRRHVECSPCFLRTCPLDFRCMNGIAPSHAAEAVFALLGKESSLRVLG